MTELDDDIFAFCYENNLSDDKEIKGFVKRGRLDALKEAKKKMNDLTDWNTGNISIAWVNKWFEEKIKELKDADLSLVELRNGIPHCKEHGAMNKLTNTSIWRCVSIYGIRNLNDRIRDKRGKFKPCNEIFDENLCKAGCEEVNDVP